MKKTKKSKAVVIWAIISAILLLVAGVANHLVAGTPGGPFDGILTSIGEKIGIDMSAGGMSGLMDTLFGGARPIYNNEVVSMYPATEATTKQEAFANAQATNLRVAEEGFVLLKNEGTALPLKKGAKISVFGKNSVNLSYGGSGSGGFDTSNNQDLYKSLTAAGFSMNPTLKSFYEDNGKSGPARSANSSDLDSGSNQRIATAETPQSKYTDAVKNSYCRSSCSCWRRFPPC